MVGAFLLGALAFVSAPGAQAQYQNYPQNRRDDDRNRRNNDDYRYGQNGQRGNFRNFEQEIRFLEQRIQRGKDQLRYESRRFGRNSYQMRSLRDQIKQDERQLKELKKEWKRAQKDRRYYGNNGNYRY
jgi:chromosome segregation ATPase